MLRRIATGELIRRRPTRRSTRLCDPMYARALRALIRDTLSPDVVHAGVKYNVIPGDAVIEVDCRVLPGHDRAARCAREVERPHRPGPPAGLRHRAHRLGRAGRVAGRRSAVGTSCRDAPRSRPRWRSRSRSWRRSRPTPSTRRARHSDLRLLAAPPRPRRAFLERFHGVDERVSLDALRSGCPSSTTWFAASAADESVAPEYGSSAACDTRTPSPRRSGSVSARSVDRRLLVDRCDHDLLIARRAGVDPAAVRPGPFRVDLGRASAARARTCPTSRRCDGAAVGSRSSVWSRSRPFLRAKAEAYSPIPPAASGSAVRGG